MEIWIVFFALLLMTGGTKSQYQTINHVNLSDGDTEVNITSPNYPQEYNNSANIWWEVKAPMGFRVRVYFIEFDLEQGFDFLEVFHGFTDLFDDVTWRARVTGNSLPDNISSIGSYLWLHFTSDDSIKKRGFSITFNAVIPDWACDFKEDTCGLHFNEGSWTLGQQRNYYYIESAQNNAWFTLNNNFASKEGSLSYGLYQDLTANEGSVSVTICKSQLPSRISIPYRIVRYHHFQYSCSGPQDIEVRFQESGRGYRIRVFDIQLYESPGPSTEAPQTSSWPTVSTENPTGPTKGIDPVDRTMPSSLGNYISTSLSTDGKMSSMTPTMAIQLPNTGNTNSTLISAVSSVIALILVILVLIAAFLYIRRRSRDSKVAGHDGKDEDDTNLYNNPVYCSKDEGFPIPDLVVCTTSYDNQFPSSQPKPANIDSQSKEFEGHRHLNTNIGDSQSHGDAFSGIISESGELNPVTYYSLEDPSAIAVNDDALNEDDYHTYEQAITPSKKPDEATTKVPKGTGSLYQDLDQPSPSTNAYSSLVTKNDLAKHGTQNGGKDGQTDGSAVLDDELEYNSLNFNKSSDITRALKTPAGVSDIKANNGYGVLDLPKEGHSEQSPQLHNDDVYNTIGGSPHEQDNTKQTPPESFSGYQALNHVQPDPQISRQGLNLKRVPPVSPGEYQSLSTGPKGLGPKMEASGSDQPDDESEYHSYQDPRQMDMDGSVPREPDAFSSDQYNILNSGKEVGDYHVYQSTTEDGMDEGTYEDFNSKTSHDDEYSTVDQMKIQDPKAVDAATFEPIYSEEVYSEFQ